MKLKPIDIRKKLVDLSSPVEDLVLGDFDAIGSVTAKKTRGRGDPLYRTAGYEFRPNYERGLLVHAMVKRYRPTRILEIGFGRGYWTTCAAKAMFECGIQGELISIDVNFEKQQVELMSKMFPPEWLGTVKMMPGRSVDIIPQLEGEFDLVYIDGDHSYLGALADWNAVKDRFRQFVIFDDYHLPSKVARGGSGEIQVARAVDEIIQGDVDYSPELIRMDRRIFVDDRGYADDEIDYGQVVMRNPNFEDPDDAYAYDWD